jgi:hypothetical protein
MGDRKWRAVVLVMSEYILNPARFAPHTEVWRCEYNTNVPICASSGKVITGRYLYGGGDYKCIECNKVYFECKPCWTKRDESADFTRQCIHCQKNIITCYECIQKLYDGNARQVEYLYTCVMCYDIICSEHMLREACDECGELMSICIGKHNNDQGSDVDTSMICHACRGRPIFFVYADCEN